MLDMFGPESDHLGTLLGTVLPMPMCACEQHTAGPIEASPCPARDERTTDSQARNREVRDALAA